MVQHFKSTSPNDTTLPDLKLPFTFCKVSQTRIRLPRASAFGNSQYWEELEDDWSMFWKAHGMEPLEKGGKAATDGKSAYSKEDRILTPCTRDILDRSRDSQLFGHRSQLVRPIGYGARISPHRLSFCYICC